MKIIYKFCLFLVMFAVFAQPSFAQLTPKMTQSQLRVVVYGDGITAGIGLPPEQKFNTKLEQKLKNDGFDVSVIDMSKEGLLVADALTNIDDVIGKSPDVVVLQLGETDVLRHLSHENLKSNLMEIVQKLQKKGIFVVVMGIKAPADTDADYAEKIRTIFVGYSGVSNIAPTYPYALEGIAGNEQMTLSDGYHPNASGVEVMVAGIYKSVKDGLRWKQGVLQQQVR